MLSIRSMTCFGRAPLEKKEAAQVRLEEAVRNDDPESATIQNLVRLSAMLWGLDSLLALLKRLLALCSLTLVRDQHLPL